jgi:hypothetical protein
MMMMLFLWDLRRADSSVDAKSQKNIIIRLSPDFPFIIETML